MEIKGLEIADEMSLEECESMLIQTVNYGDFLAEQRKQKRIDLKENKRHYKQQRLIRLAQIKGQGDAKWREAEADKFAETEFDRMDTDEIEADFIKDLLANNHDKTEALRSILSSKKAVFEKTYSNRV